MRPGWLWFLADEILSIVGVARAGPFRNLWIGAQRASHVHAVVRYARGNNPSRSHAGFAPAFHSTDRVELIRTWAARAMLHAGLHEKTHPVVLCRSKLRQHTGVVVDRVLGRNELIVPTVIQKKFASTSFESAQVRVDSIYETGLFSHERSVLFQIKAVPIPLRIFMRNVFKSIEGNSKGFWPAGNRTPPQLRTALKTREKR